MSASHGITPAGASAAVQAALPPHKQASGQDSPRDKASADTGDISIRQLYLKGVERGEIAPNDVRPRRAMRPMPPPAAPSAAAVGSKRARKRAAAPSPGVEAGRPSKIPGRYLSTVVGHETWAFFCDTCCEAEDIEITLDAEVSSGHDYLAQYGPRCRTCQHVFVACQRCR